MTERWQNQEEAYHFVLGFPNAMLNMDMGTGKTRVAIDASLDIDEVKKVLILCPKTVIPVWRTNFNKFAGDRPWSLWDEVKGSVSQKSTQIAEFFMGNEPCTRYAVLNYDIAWRDPLGETLRRVGFDMVILDESHRVKSPNSKISKYVYLLGKRVERKLCLSGTPMANSPLDVYGQYRFLDPYIFGTRFDIFKEQYAVLAGPERRFVVGYKNLQELNKKFQSIAYTCKMEDVKDRIKLPEVMPDLIRGVDLPSGSLKLMKELKNEFVAEIGNSGSFVVLKNVLNRVLRFQQICSGFVPAKENPGDDDEVHDINNSKVQSLTELLEDLPGNEPVVIFGVFRHDMDSIRAAAGKAGRPIREISGRINQYDNWSEKPGTVLAVQVKAGSEGVDFTASRYGVYFNLPHSLFLYEQSKARLYRPGQTQNTQFIYLLAKDTIDEDIYDCLSHKKEIIEEIQRGITNFKFLR